MNDEEKPDLRDRFAMCALSGLLAAQPEDAREWPDPSGLTDLAYEYADAMLRARARRAKGSQ